MNVQAFLYIDRDTQGGIGIELWTMTEDILFDNIYVGHSEDDAKKLAAETFDVKKPLEEAENKKATKIDEEDEEPKTFKEDPVAFIRQKVLDFVEVAKVDPVFAFKSQPETGAAIVAAFTTFLGVILSLIGVIGAAQKPITKVCALLPFILICV